jgi:hypothetical protein
MTHRRTKTPTPQMMITTMMPRHLYLKRPSVEYAGTEDERVLVAVRPDANRSERAPTARRLK